MAEGTVSSSVECQFQEFIYLSVSMTNIDFKVAFTLSISDCVFAVQGDVLIETYSSLTKRTNLVEFSISSKRTTLLSNRT